MTQQHHQGFLPSETGSNFEALPAPLHVAQSVFVHSQLESEIISKQNLEWSERSHIKDKVFSALMLAYAVRDVVASCN